MKRHDDREIRPYTAPAGGWGALKHVAINLIREKVAAGHYKTLFRQNQPDGFDCPGCAWPDRKHTSTFEFCENGVKAVAAEATSKRVTPAFFAEHSVTELMQQSDYALEQHGRLTDPVVYDPDTDRYRPIAWEEAYALVARHLQALADPDEAAFYTSGRTSNEAAFAYQLFVRLFGTNNFPDCSNMCHESTSRGLPATVGVGKGTVTLDDFERADTLLIFGQNPATNHPRMMTELRDCAKRGARIVSINPLKERGLERFASPQHVHDMLSKQGTPIASVFIRPTLGGDFSLIKGVAKYVLERDDAARAQGLARVLDVDFIAEHTSGFDAFADDLRAERWEALEEDSGVPREQIEQLGRIFVEGERVIATWGMGITQHKNSVRTVQMLSNLMMMRGQIGLPGAGLCPVRGHSNVQGNRTVGIDEKPTAAFLDKLGAAFDFTPPREHGYDVVETIEAMLDGRVKVFIGLGGNFAMATPDTPRTWEGLRACELTVQIATKLNRSHLVHGKAALLLPTLGRTEIDVQEGVPQGVTVEDSMSMVHLSYGMNTPASRQLRSEMAIVAGMAHATLGSDKVDWLSWTRDYALVRDAIARSVDGFADYNARVAEPGGFHLRVASRQLRSEMAIVAGMAHATLGSGKVDWLGWTRDYALVRDAIAQSVDGFADYNARVAEPGGFHLRVASREREWKTPTGKANFLPHRIELDTPIRRAKARHGERVMTLMTTRSHDQYNTTIYALDDRYRGVFGQRRVVLAHAEDIAMLGLAAGERVDLETVWDDGIERRVEGFLLVAYDIPRGCIGAYYPETNPLVPLSSVSDISNTPTSKSIPVLLTRSRR